MKRNTDNQIKYQSNAVFEGHDAKISESDMDKLWDLLQDPYKNPIGAVVREYVSNSFDAHAEAAFVKDNSIEDIRKEYSIYNNYSDEYITELKNHLQVFDNDAVKVSISKDDSGWYWATEDFGVGLSAERIVDVFCNYLKSTKEDTNNLIGAFGIGSKSGLSYTDAFFIRSRYNGKEYQYVLRKGEKSPRLDKIFEVDTTERNGTEIKIYIKDYKKYDWQDSEPEIPRFQAECRAQLAYFDNVFFSDKLSIKNNYVIFEGENWKYSTNGNPFSGMHLCLGKVAYPIDWDNLGIEKINLDLALKFDIGELDIIQTREDVKYTPRTVKAIKDKIEALKKEFKAKWQKDTDYETEDLLYYIKNKGSFPMIKYEIGNDAVQFNIKSLYDEGEIPDIIFKPLEKYSDKVSMSSWATWRFFLDYNSPSYVNNSGLKHNNSDLFALFTNEKSVYRIEGNHNTRKSKYIFQEEENNTVFYFLRKQTPKLKKYKENWNLENLDKSEWRDFISTMQKEVLKCIAANSKSYSKVEIDQEWLVSTYKKKEARDNTVFNFYKYASNGYYGGSWNNPLKYKKGTLDKDTRSLYIVGLKEDKRLLNWIHNELRNANKVPSKFLKVGYIAKANVKYFQDVKNLINPENYMKHRIFIRMATLYHIEKTCNFLKLLDSAGYLDSWASVFSPINKQIGEYLKDIYEYHKINQYRDMHEPLGQSVYKYVKENDLFDKDILIKADAIEKYMKGLDILKGVNRNVAPSVIARFIYMFNRTFSKQFHKPMNPNFYVNLNEEQTKWLSESEKTLYHDIKQAHYV
jgi:hypothetical protein